MSITAALKASVELEAVTLLKPENTCVLDPPAARSVSVMLATAFVPLKRTPLARLSGDDEAGSFMTSAFPRDADDVAADIAAGQGDCLGLDVAAIDPPEIEIASVPSLPDTLPFTDPAEIAKVSLPALPLTSPLMAPPVIVNASSPVSRAIASF